ncbi:hypothetical protein [Ruegeria sp. ANG-S4]|uniref:hypothetical protein n=1 Tax=Ruegeria sp. ANG-S4 TaxID=1577904 RepID=UPI00068CA8D6|nr:hypothetical protein [Ruegeria sp. ANG-S4]
MFADQMSSCISQQWSPVIGDPSVLGWVTVAGYGVSAILCFAAWRRTTDGAVRLFWLVLSIFLVCLMINKQLDLQSAFTAAARCLSQFQGWYEKRRIVQVSFILAIMMSGTMVTAIAFWTLRQHLRQIGLALIGFAFLICFVLIRAAGFHNFDAFLNTEIQSVRLNWVLELTSIALIAANAVAALRRRDHRRGTV